MNSIQENINLSSLWTSSLTSRTSLMTSSSFQRNMFWIENQVQWQESNAFPKTQGSKSCYDKDFLLIFLLHPVCVAQFKTFFNFKHSLQKTSHQKQIHHLIHIFFKVCRSPSWCSLCVLIFVLCCVCLYLQRRETGMNIPKTDKSLKQMMTGFGRQ